MAVNMEGYNRILQQLAGKNVTLVAVSKIRTVQEIQELYDMGQRDFGENYVQELVEKYEALPKDIRWHFIGHLQTNKVKYIAPFVALIHGVDSEKLLGEIRKQGSKFNREIPCLLQVYISKDETKFGFDEQELDSLVQHLINNEKPDEKISIQGLMGMATFTEDNDLIISEFNNLDRIFLQTKDRLSKSHTKFSILSMGMSADYMLAVAAGSTMVRIGSLLFGSRSKT